MKDVDQIAKTNGVDRTVRVAVIVSDYLQNSRSSKRATSAQRLGIGVLAADLGQIDGIADNVLDVIRKLLQVAEAAADPYDILLDRHYGSSTIECQ